jgi:Sec-independent protein translocase protein TatA
MTSARKWAVIAVVAILLIGAGFFAWSFYELGGKSQEVKTSKAETKATVNAANTATATVRADLARADTTGKAREVDRARLDEFFEDLNREAAHAPTAAADLYVLPDDRLRIWRDANAGRTAQGGATSEPDQGASGAAAALVGRDRSPGGEPPPGREGLSPARIADVSAAVLPAVADGGL